MKIKVYNHSDYYVDVFGNISRGVNKKPIKRWILNRGYAVVYLHKNGIIKMRTVHRILAIAFIPNPENKPQINHINGIKSDNRIENLEWATAKENISHAYRTGLAVSKGRPKKGESNANSKMTELEVINICDLIMKGNSFPKIKKEHTNLTKSIFSYIRTKKGWKHITLKYEFPDVSFEYRKGNGTNLKPVIDTQTGVIYRSSTEAAISVGRTASSIHHAFSRGTEKQFKYL